MAVDPKITIFTAAMRSEFLKAYNALRPTKQLDVARFATMIPSTSRIESYPWMSPPPRLKAYTGKRNFQFPDVVNYKVENKQFDAAEMVRIRDVEDDQVGGYGTRMQALAADVVGFPAREIIKLANANGPCFDGSNFFADSHTIGTGDNNLTFDAASNDGKTHKIITLHVGGPMKPLGWQMRKDKGLKDNASSPASEEEGFIKYWYDYEGAPVFGFWWDAVLTTITDTPTVNEMETIFNNIEVAMRGFKLDKANPADDDFVIHEQLEFNTTDIIHIVNPSLKNIAKTVLVAENIQAGTNGGQKTNIYRGLGDLMVSAVLGA